MKAHKSMHLSVQQRFEMRFLKTDACWPWSGSTDRYGYGMFSPSRGARGLAHRASWEFYRGTIPAGMQVCHSCDVRCCVNPEHLFLGTPAANSADMVAKGRQARGEMNGQAKLKPEDVSAILRDERPQQRIAEDYGISQPAVWAIKARKKWAHITAAILLALATTACADKAPVPPEVTVVRVIPPEAVVRCPETPSPAALPALPAGPTVPRAAVQARDRVTTAFLGAVLGALGTCQANSQALRSFFGFDKAAPAAATTPR